MQDVQSIEAVPWGLLGFSKPPPSASRPSPLDFLGRPLECGSRRIRNLAGLGGPRYDAPAKWGTRLARIGQLGVVSSGVAPRRGSRKQRAKRAFVLDVERARAVAQTCRFLEEHQCQSLVRRSYFRRPGLDAIRARRDLFGGGGGEAMARGGRVTAHGRRAPTRRVTEPNDRRNRVMAGPKRLALEADIFARFLGLKNSIDKLQRRSVGGLCCGVCRRLACLAQRSVSGCEIRSTSRSAVRARANAREGKCLASLRQKADRPARCRTRTDFLARDIGHWHP